MVIAGVEGSAASAPKTGDRATTRNSKRGDLAFKGRGVRESGRCFVVTLPVREIQSPTKRTLRFSAFRFADFSGIPRFIVDFFRLQRGRS
jgi:hypothetical protein